MRKITVGDIAELRAYNKVRDELRSQIMALKARRRVQLGPIMSLMFENRDTVHWQISEMVRAERITTEEGVATEVKIYNDLIPNAGELSATMFLELTTADELREWLPRLVGIHRALRLVLVDGSEAPGFDPEAERLTREEMTAAVHFLKFRLRAEQVAAFAEGGVHLVVDHPEYRHDVVLTAEQHAELLADFG